VGDYGKRVFGVNSREINWVLESLRLVVFVVKIRLKGLLA